MPKLTAQYKLNDDQLKQLKQIVPEAFKDNILDFNSLYEALSDSLEDDENSDLEQFGLSWPGKRQAKRAAVIPPVGTLAPVKGDGVDEDTTKNIYIEGDNLEVLKILKKSYTGRVKMIYIDPPYNTGNDFIYPDDFSESVESFQRRTGQLNENNEKMTTNNRSDGRFHSKWLSMMYPRLRLARELLREDGVIFISIDDNEVAQLRKVCDEVFGEENFINQVTWVRTRSGKTVTKQLLTNCDYLLIYSKSINYAWNTVYQPLAEATIKMYSKDDNDGRGKYRLYPMQKTSSPGPETTYDYIDNNGKVWKCPSKGWRMIQSKIKILENEGRLCLENEALSEKAYWNERISEGRIADTLWNDLSENSIGVKEIQTLLGSVVFNNPKPTDYIIRMLNIATTPSDIIFDFFSGSSTTAHAIMQLNAEDNGNRKFIMVQLPEPCNKDSEAFKAGYKNICEIGKERIRRAGKKIQEEAGLNAASLDTGFKVFRLAPSNYKAWENYNGTDVKQLEELFKADSLVSEWKEDDLLTEVMLLEGFPLDSKIEQLPQFKKNKIRRISSEFHENTLYICLDKNINNETINALNITDKDRFICLDSAIDDQSKIRLEDKNLIKTL